MVMRGAGAKYKGEKLKEQERKRQLQVEYQLSSQKPLNKTKSKELTAQKEKK